MLNFTNLNDIEFEYLCKDIMSKMLGVELQRFAPGRDGGVDLADNVFTKNIVVQVKHYIKTDISGLLSSLRKEIPKVEEAKPKKYYICCSKELTPQNKKDIYEMFSDYMDSTANIVTLIEINDFLEQAENADVLHKHFKLWIESTNILTDIYTNDICIDSDALLSDIEDSVQMFVKTSAYDYALKCLEKNNVLIIIGNPGVGKTITSKMLILHYASLGYRVRYTTDGADLSALKKALTQSSEAKEVILLDDCFGQAYFSMKETQENELLALIKHIKGCSNKVLIMNSRVTIYQEAKERTPNLVKSFDRKEYKAFVLDMDNISSVEKAKIFYNHMFFSNVPQEYRENIRWNKNYRKIVMHPNYNPRIIEFVCSQRQLAALEPHNYTDFIIQCLQNPEQMWKNEYERRIKNIDRILLTTLYSLTNTMVSIDMVKKCYEYRISRIADVDVSINHFEQSVNRLLNSMIKIVDVEGIKMLSVANPSVNDFICAHLEKNEPEKNAVLETSITLYQLKRLMSDDRYEERVKQIFADESILSYEFESDEQKTDFIVYYCVTNKIKNKKYLPYIEAFITDIHPLDIMEEYLLSAVTVLDKLFEKDICLFYGVSNIVSELSTLKSILMKLDFDEIVGFIKKIDYLFKGRGRLEYIEMVKDVLEETVADYCVDVPVSSYDIDVSSIIDEHMIEHEFGAEVDIDAVVADIEDEVKCLVQEEIYEFIDELPMDLRIDYKVFSKELIDVSGSSSIVDNYLRYDDYDDDYETYRERRADSQEVDYIFER